MVIYSIIYIIILTFSNGANYNFHYFSKLFKYVLTAFSKLLTSLAKSISKAKSCIATKCGPNLLTFGSTPSITLYNSHEIGLRLVRLWSCKYLHLAIHSWNLF